ncbi:MAG: hypothetical protein ABI462_07405 [Ignavibacteria bacterium]
MPTIVVRHKVGDIDTWLKGHEDRKKLFGPGISGFKTFQDADDPKSVILVIEVTDMYKFGAILNDPTNADIKAKHTVLEPIIVSKEVAL